MSQKNIKSDIKSKVGYSDIQMVENLGTTHGIIHAKLYESRVKSVAVEWEYPKKSEIEYPDKIKKILNRISG